MEKNKKITIDDLAEMVGRGFNDMGERMVGLEGWTTKVEQGIDSLRQGQERIEMRLNNVVYRTELDAVLDRVQILEKQMKEVFKKG